MALGFNVTDLVNTGKKILDDKIKSLTSPEALQSLAKGLVSKAKTGATKTLITQPAATAPGQITQPASILPWVLGGLGLVVAVGTVVYIVTSRRRV